MYRRILIVAVAGAIGLSACGGSSEKQAAAGVVETTSSTTAAPTSTTAAPTTSTTVAPTTTSTPAPVTKAAYIRQANAICQVMNDKSDALPDPGQDVAKVLAMFEQGRAITADAVAQLRALRPPAGEEAALKAIWAKVDTVIADVDQAIAALKAGNLQQFLAVADRIDASQNAANAASNAYGLTVCGEES